MKEEQKTIINDQEYAEELDLLDLLIVILKRKKIILWMTFSVAIATMIYSLILPRIYIAETKIFHSQKGGADITTQLMSQFGGLAGLAGEGVGGSSDFKLLVQMIKSRTILDIIIDRFDLENVYKKKYRVDARGELSENLRVEEDNKSGVIKIAIEDKDPQKASEMANAFVEELKDLVKKIAITEASQRRLFFEEQLEGANMNLVNAEESMRELQERTGALQIESQTKAVIEGIANMRAQVAQKEVQLQVMRSYSTPSNPDLQKVTETIKGLKKELRKLESGKGGEYDPLMSTGRMPEVGTEYLRKYRDLKFNETLYGLLLNQYEAAKLDEARDAMIIQVIDRAVPPEKKSKPGRASMIIVATLIGFLLSIFGVFFKEHVECVATHPGNSERVEAFKKYFTFST